MSSPIVSCSFCSTPSNELPKGSLLKGREGGTFICAGCVSTCHQVLADKQLKDAAPEEAKLPKPIEIKAILDQHVIAQERAKKDIAVAVYQHYKRQRVHQKTDVEIQKSNILMLGPSGSGKTELFRAISKALKVPFYCQDCTSLTMSGYVGADTEDILRGLVEASSGDPKRAEWGIVLLDEFDKLARKSGKSASGYRDVSGEGVQQGLLKLIEGDRVAVTRGRGKNAAISMIGADGQVKSNVDMIDTTNILFVAAGSFAGIEHIVDRRVNKKARVGFGGEESRRKEITPTQAYEHVTQDDILEFGIIPEILGRLPVLTSTYELSDEDMVRILTEPKHAVVKQFKELFQLDGIELTFEPEALIKVAQIAKQGAIGARGLRTILEKVLNSHAYNLPSDSSVKTLHITADQV